MAKFLQLNAFYQKLKMVKQRTPIFAKATRFSNDSPLRDILNRKSFQQKANKTEKLHSLRLRLASPKKIKQWAERILPNGDVVGEVTNAQTVNYKTLKPEKGGLFCERIFGPVKDFTCACGKQNIEQNPQVCAVCGVPYISSQSRRYKLGYIKFVSPVTHIWYLKNTPSSLALLLNINRKKLEAVTYCSENFSANTQSFKHELDLGNIEPLLKNKPFFKEELEIPSLEEKKLKKTKTLVPYGQIAFGEKQSIKTGTENEKRRGKGKEVVQKQYTAPTVSDSTSFDGVLKPTVRVTTPSPSFSSSTSSKADLKKKLYLDYNSNLFLCASFASSQTFKDEPFLLMSQNSKLIFADVGLDYPNKKRNILEEFLDRENSQTENADRKTGKFLRSEVLHTIYKKKRFQRTANEKQPQYLRNKIFYPDSFLPPNFGFWCTADKKFSSIKNHAILKNLKTENSELKDCSFIVIQGSHSSEVENSLVKARNPLFLLEEFRALHYPFFKQEKLSLFHEDSLFYDGRPEFSKPLFYKTRFYRDCSFLNKKHADYPLFKNNKKLSLSFTGSQRLLKIIENGNPLLKNLRNSIPKQNLDFETKNKGQPCLIKRSDKTYPPLGPLGASVPLGGLSQKKLGLKPRKLFSPTYTLVLESLHKKYWEEFESKYSFRKSFFEKKEKAELQAEVIKKSDGRFFTLLYLQLYTPLSAPIDSPKPNPAKDYRMFFSKSIVRSVGFLTRMFYNGLRIERLIIAEFLEKKGLLSDVRPKKKAVKEFYKTITIFDNKALWEKSDVCLLESQGINFSIELLKKEAFLGFLITGLIPSEAYRVLNPIHHVVEALDIEDDAKQELGIEPLDIEDDEELGHFVEDLPRLFQNVRDGKATETGPETAPDQISKMMADKDLRNYIKAGYLKRAKPRTEKVLPPATISPPDGPDGPFPMSIKEEGVRSSLLHRKTVLRRGVFKGDGFVANSITKDELPKEDGFVANSITKDEDLPGFLPPVANPQTEEEQEAYDAYREFYFASRDPAKDPEGHWIGSPNRKKKDPPPKPATGGYGYWSNSFDRKEKTSEERAEEEAAELELFGYLTGPGHERDELPLPESSDMEASEMDPETFQVFKELMSDFVLPPRTNKSVDDEDEEEEGGGDVDPLAFLFESDGGEASSLHVSEEIEDFSSSSDEEVNELLEKKVDQVIRDYNAYLAQNNADLSEYEEVHKKDFELLDCEEENREVVVRNSGIFSESGNFKVVPQNSEAAAELREFFKEVSTRDNNPSEESRAFLNKNWLTPEQKPPVWLRLPHDEETSQRRWLEDTCRAFIRRALDQSNLKFLHVSEGWKPHRTKCDNFLFFFALLKGKVKNWRDILPPFKNRALHYCYGSLYRYIWVKKTSLTLGSGVLENTADRIRRSVYEAGVGRTNAKSLHYRLRLFEDFCSPNVSPIEITRKYFFALYKVDKVAAYYKAAKPVFRPYLWSGRPKQNFVKFSSRLPHFRYKKNANLICKGCFVTAENPNLLKQTTPFLAKNRSNKPLSFKNPLGNSEFLKYVGLQLSSPYLRSLLIYQLKKYKKERWLQDLLKPPSGGETQNTPSNSKWESLYSGNATLSEKLRDKRYDYKSYFVIKPLRTSFVKNRNYPFTKVQARVLTRRTFVRAKASSLHKGSGKDCNICDVHTPEERKGKQILKVIIENLLQGENKFFNFSYPSSESATYNTELSPLVYFSSSCSLTRVLPITWKNALSSPRVFQQPLYDFVYEQPKATALPLKGSPIALCNRCWALVPQIAETQPIWTVWCLTQPLKGSPIYQKAVIKTFHSSLFKDLVSSPKKPRDKKRRAKAKRLAAKKPYLHFSVRSLLFKKIRFPNKKPAGFYRKDSTGVKNLVYKKSSIHRNQLLKYPVFLYGRGSLRLAKAYANERAKAFANERTSLTSEKLRPKIFLGELQERMFLRESVLVNNFYVIPQSFTWPNQIDWKHFLNFIAPLADKKDRFIPSYLERGFSIEVLLTGAGAIHNFLTLFNPNKHSSNKKTEQSSLILSSAQRPSNISSICKSVFLPEVIKETKSTNSRESSNVVVLKKGEFNLGKTAFNNSSKPVAKEVFSEFDFLITQINANVNKYNQEIKKIEDFLKYQSLFIEDQERVEKMFMKLIVTKTLRIKALRRLKILRPFKNSGVLPEWMVLSTLPVLPPALRPIITLGEQVAVSDLNKFYQTVLFRNKRVHRFTNDSYSLNSSEELRYAQRLLQEAVDALIENGKGDSVAITAANNRPLKSLSDMLKGKKGRFRQNLLGKRVDYSGRSVIVVGPKLKIYECGLPKVIALELFQPFLIRRLIFQKITRNFVSAKKLIKSQAPIVFEVLSEVMKNRPVLLNRAPTLHRLGIQAFQPKLVAGKAILIHPLVCNAFNADFDGDQMAVHIPLSLQACAEAWKLMGSINNLISPATGEPILLPSQDMVLGCYFLTTLDKVKMKKRAIGTELFQSHLVPTRTTGEVEYKEKAFIEKPIQPKQKYFHNWDQVLQCLNQELIHLHNDFIWLRWNGYYESPTKKVNCLEARIDEAGNSVVITQAAQTYYDSFSEKTVTYIRTTAGRVIMNQIITETVNKPSQKKGFYP